MYGLPGLDVGGLGTDGGGRARLGTGAPLRLRAHPGRGQPVGSLRRGRTAARGHGGGPVLGPGPRGSRAGLRALRDLQLRAGRLARTPQPRVLARRRVPRQRPGGVRVRRRRALQQRQAREPLLRRARRWAASHRQLRAADAAAAARRAPRPWSAGRPTACRPPGWPTVSGPILRWRGVWSTGGRLVSWTRPSTASVSPSADSSSPTPSSPTWCSQRRMHSRIDARGAILDSSPGRCY